MISSLNLSRFLMFEKFLDALKGVEKKDSEILKFNVDETVN